MKNGVKIMILEGSDIKKLQEGRIVQKEFNGVFADSMLLDKLKKNGLNVNKVDKTYDIVAVEFNNVYTSLKADEVVEEIIKYKNDKKDDIQKVDSEYRELVSQKNKLQGNNKLSALGETEKEQVKDLNKKIKDNRLEKKPYLDKINELKQSVKGEILNKYEIRDDLYNNGFSLDTYKKDYEGNYILDKTIKYVYLFRSPSKSKQGSVIYINEDLFKDISKWQRMGIELPKEKAKLVELEAYKSLTSSAIIGYTTINPESEILVLNDLISHSEYDCILVKTYDQDKINKMIKDNPEGAEEYKKLLGKTYTERDKYNLSNVLFDGQAILEDSLFGSAPNDKIQWVNGEYINNSFLVLRHHFFKMCGFRGKVQKFFIDYCEEHGEDYNEFKVIDKYGRVLNAKDIKMITTENAMKWEKFFDDKAKGMNAWIEAVKADDNKFGIAKVDHDSKYGEKYQSASYQIFNSLPVENDTDIKNLCQPTIDFMNSLKGKDSIDNYIKYLKMTNNEMNMNQMMIDLYEHNNDFSQSYLFRDYKRKTLFKHKEEKLKNGRLMFSANNCTIVFNPYAMLLHSVKALDKYITHTDKEYIIKGYEDPTLPVIDKKCVSVYAPKFKEEYLASFRSPHNSMNNIGYNKNIKHKYMEDYFVFNGNVMAVNAIETNEQDRKNGQDADSDFNFVSNDETMVKCALKAQEFPTIVNRIEKEDKCYNNTPTDLALIDDGLSKSKNEIGIGSNLAQIALSHYWDTKNKDLEDYVAILAVVVQCSIDNSKRKFKVKIGGEISRIRKAIMNINGTDVLYKPHFWQFTNESFDKDDEEQVSKIKKMNCPMDKIYEYLDEIKTDSKKDRIADITFIESIKGEKNRDQYKKIEDAVKIYDTKISEIKVKRKFAKKDWQKEQLNRAEKKAYEELNEVFEKITKITPKTIQMLLNTSLAVKGELRENQKTLLKMLYKHFKVKFKKCFKGSINKTKNKNTKKKKPKVAQS